MKSQAVLAGVARGVLMLLLMMARGYAGENCFLISDAMTRGVLLQEGTCTRAVTPASTFDVALSLMAYDAVILDDASHPVWPFKKGYVDWLPEWQRSHTPSSWIRSSCVWFSQEIIRLLGEERLMRYLRMFAYGNQDVSGAILGATDEERKQHNALTYSWLSSSLLISPLEQERFLSQFLRHLFPVSERAYSMTSRIFYKGDIGNHWRLYGRAGTGWQLYADGTRNTTRQLGWFIGWVSRDDRRLIVVRLMQDREEESTYAGPRTEADSLRKLQAFLATIP